jgi:predicted metal-dependent hydrolase
MMAQASPAMQKLWQWHALEETEHKAVAFDLYQAIGGNYAWRVRWFLFASIQFAIDSLRQTVNNLWHDGTLFKPSTWLSAAQFMLGRPSRGGGWLWLTAGPLLAYFKRDFHPWQQDNRAHAQAYALAHAKDWKLVR